jgi:NAD(P)-dependent dehydrogenase (short-subunit alcohol dehydrogenase family)
MRVFITGANRGIGLALTRQYLERGDTVFAAARTPDSATDLHALKQTYADHLTIVALDVTDAAQIHAAVETVRSQVDALDILINNAGVNPPRETQTLANIEFDLLHDTLHINTIAPLQIAQAFRKLLQAGDNAKLVNISSQMGSMTWKAGGGFYAYSTSKAALNMVSNLLGADLKPFGVITVAIHPGWVQTDMGGENAAVTPEDSAAGIIRVTDGLTLPDSGKFFNWEGEIHPW